MAQPASGAPQPDGPMAPMAEGADAKASLSESLAGYADDPASSKMVSPKHKPKDAPAKRAGDRWKTFVTRSASTIAMVSCFVLFLAAGHLSVILLVTGIQIMSFSEIMNIPSGKESKTSNKQKALSRNISWYFFAITMYYLYGESIIFFFKHKHIVVVNRMLLPLANHHRFLCFAFYVFGFIFFVASLKEGYYRFQFTQFGWTHMALILIPIQAHFIVNNILEGLIWFLLPASLVIINDSSAYLCGILFGKTQLIQLSPNKTLEGFIGAWIITLFSGFVMTHYMIKSSYLICPAQDFNSSYLAPTHCDPNPVFVPQTYQLPFAESSMFSSIEIAPIHFHCLAFTIFASWIAPFGGFFASGVKRSFDIKNFGESFPGHGGMTDRMDCQFIMGFFAYLYSQSFTSVYLKVSLGDFIQNAVTGLNSQEQVELLTMLSKHLVGEGIIPSGVTECITNLLEGSA